MLISIRQAVRPAVDEPGTRTRRRTIQGWQSDTARRDALGSYVADRGPVARGDAVLCALYWLERQDAPACELGDLSDVSEVSDSADQRGDPSAAPAPASGLRPVTPCEIASLYPAHRGRRLTGVADFLGRLAQRGLAYPAARSSYHTTPLGGAVVEALPDTMAVAALCGLRVRRAPTRR